MEGFMTELGCVKQLMGIFDHRVGLDELYSDDSGSSWTAVDLDTSWSDVMQDYELCIATEANSDALEDSFQCLVSMFMCKMSWQRHALRTIRLAIIEQTMVDNE